MFWCNWGGGGGGAQFSPTAKSPESETSNQWCQQLALCSAAPQTLKRRPTPWTRVMIVWAPDTQITLISAKQQKAGAIKINLYTDPAVNTATVPLFTASVMMLEAMKAREAELEMWSLTPRRLFYFFNKTGCNTEMLNKWNSSLSLRNKWNLPSSSLAPIAVRAVIFLWRINI